MNDLGIPAQEVIDAYIELFQVEKPFRMSRSDLKALPIFHRKRDSIEAHLTIVFAALAISRRIEAAAGISIKKFVQRLRLPRTGKVNLNGNSYENLPKIPDEELAILHKLDFDPVLDNENRYYSGEVVLHSYAIEFGTYLKYVRRHRSGGHAVKAVRGNA